MRVTRHGPLILAILLLVVLLVPVAAAGQAPAGQAQAPTAAAVRRSAATRQGAPAQQGQGGASQPAPSGPVAGSLGGVDTVASADEPAAHETRDTFTQLLEKYPPSLGRVLKLDPSLLARSEYLSDYPALAAFLETHPEVAHNPEFFLSRVAGDSDAAAPDSESRAFDLFQDVMNGVAAFSVFLVVTGALMWLLRTVIDYRRWSRLSKVQAEVHNKLLDRFAANEDLIAYMGTEAGRRFLESAPIPLDSEPRALAAPLGRILWSLQAGVVVSALGFGLRYVAGRVPDEIASPVASFSALTIALGLGFVVSAIISYVLSRRLGLVPPAPPRSVSEPGASA